MNTFQKACTFILIGVVFNASAYGASPAKRSVALELAMRVGVEEQWAEFSNDCRKIVPGGIFDPAAALKLNPQSFGGITPESKFWPRIQKIYRDYQLAVCDGVTQSAIRDSLADSFEQEMTMAELEKALQFYASPEGSRFTKVLNLAAAKIRLKMNSLVSGYDSPVYRSMYNALQELMIEYQKNRH